MQAKFIMLMMLITLLVLFFVTHLYKQKHKKISKFEQYLFEKILQENGAIEKIQDELIAYGKALGIKDNQIHGLLKRNDALSAK